MGTTTGADWLEARVMWSGSAATVTVEGESYTFADRGEVHAFIAELKTTTGREVVVKARRIEVAS